MSITKTRATRFYDRVSDREQRTTRDFENSNVIKARAEAGRTVRITDVKMLIAEVERLEQDLLELNEANTVLHGAWESQYAELAATQKQLDAAVEDVTHTAHNCASKDECGVVKLDHSYCFKCVAWQWRGAEGSEAQQ